MFVVITPQVLLSLVTDGSVWVVWRFVYITNIIFVFISKYIFYCIVYLPHAFVPFLYYPIRGLLENASGIKSADALIYTEGLHYKNYIQFID